MKGMTNTPFAILAASLLLMLFLTPLNSVQEGLEQNVLKSEASNMQSDNVENSFKKGLGITASNYINASNNYVVENGFVSDAEAAIDFENGEFNSVQMNFTDYNEWASSLETSYADNGNELEYTFSNLELVEGLKIKGVSDLQYNFSPQGSSTTYSFDDRAEGLDGVRGPDPLLADASGGAFTPDYSYCGFERPAQQLGLGSQSSNEVAHGYAVVEPDELNPESNQILVVENASEYNSIELSDFNGIIAEAENTISNGDYATVSGLNIASIVEGDSLIINNDQIWRSHFRKMINENCYVENSNAPGIFNRMEGSFSQSNKALTTVVGDESNSNNVNEAYLYYSGDSVSNSSIKGVTSGDYLNDKAWFKLSDENIAEWDLETLTG